VGGLGGRDGSLGGMTRGAHGTATRLDEGKACAADGGARDAVTARCSVGRVCTSTRPVGCLDGVEEKVLFFLGIDLT
jgi:hypothetical protein